jgi:hypothetical protein
LCVAILSFLKTHGGRVTLSQLRRDLNGYRRRETFKAAIRHLQDLGAITIEKESGTRRQWVTLVQVPERYETTRPKPKPFRRHQPRSRGQTPWFQSLMTRRTEEQFVSLRDNLDLSTPSGRLMFQIIGAMAEFERSLIQECVRAGLRNARLKGKTLGRPRRIVDGGEMIRLRKEGKSLRAIAEAVGASAATVRTRLRPGA